METHDEGFTCRLPIFRYSVYRAGPKIKLHASVVDFEEWKMLLLAELCSWSRNVCLYMCMHVYSFECFKANFFIDKALELIDKYNVILFYIIFFLGGG